MPSQPAYLRKSAGNTRLGFNGQVLEPWGCYSLGHGHRVYSPSLLVFLRPDNYSPFDRGGPNAYAYCGGDPVNATDPTGRWTDEVESYLFPVISFATSYFLLRLHVYTIVNPESTKLAVKAGYISASGSVAGMLGAVMRLGGVSAGTWVSAAGTALSGVGAAMRTPIQKRALKAAQARQAKKEEERERRLAAQNVTPPDFVRSNSAPSGSLHTSRAATPLREPAPSTPVASSPTPMNSPSSAPSTLSRGALLRLDGGRVREIRRRQSIIDVNYAQVIRDGD